MNFEFANRVIRSQQSGVEIERQVLPLVVMLRFQHRERLAQVSTARSALSAMTGPSGDAVPPTRRVDAPGSRRSSSAAEQDMDIALSGIPRGGFQHCLRRARSASISLCESCAAGAPVAAPSVALVIERFGGSKLALRLALVEQRRDLIGVELGRVLGLLGGLSSGLAWSFAASFFKISAI